MIPAFVLSWRSPAMHACAFWYYATRAEAEQDATRLQAGTTYDIHAALIPEAQQHLINVGRRKLEP